MLNLLIREHFVHSLRPAPRRQRQFPCTLGRCFPAFTLKEFGSHCRWMKMSETATFCWLRSGEEAFAAMLEAIGEASASIRLETYIYEASPLGERFRDGFVKARQRGVQVQVLVDALGSIRLTSAF